MLGRSVKADEPYGERPDGRRDAPDPLGSGGDGWGDAATWCGESATALIHVNSRVPRAALDFLCGDACRMRVETDSARPDAILVESNRHCSPVLLDSCPPACRRCMGSARANRSGRSPESVWKEFDGLEPLGAADVRAVVSWEGESRAWDR